MVHVGTWALHVAKEARPCKLTFNRFAIAKRSAVHMANARGFHKLNPGNQWPYHLIWHVDMYCGV